MKTYVKNTGYLDAIFERDQEGHYTKAAIFYQDILRYYFVINPPITGNKWFRLLDLEKWLVKNNLQIKEYFQDSRSHTSPSNKVHIKKEQINRKFEDLISMNLIQKIGQKTYESAKKILVRADIYEYTDQGILILLIIRSNNDNENVDLALNKADKKLYSLGNIYSAIYDTLDSILMKWNEPPYMNIFYSSLFKKFKLRGSFPKLVQKMYNILNLNKTITNVGELLALTFSSTYSDSNTQREFFELWNQTIKELEPDVRQIVLHQLKLNAELRYQKMKAPLSRIYEKVRFQYRANFNYIIVGGDCKICGYCDVIPLEYIEYVRSIMDPNSIIKILECKKCKAKDCMIISKF